MSGQRLPRPMTVVLRVDRQPVLRLDDQVRALGIDPVTIQVHEVQTHRSHVWRVWRVFSNVAPVDHVPPLTPSELNALDVQPGVVGVWFAR